MPEIGIAGIALGSNLPSSNGSPEANLREAIVRVGALGRVAAVSSFRVTAPVGFTEQPEFVNGALLLETTWGPLELMRELLGIEVGMGRVRVGVPAKGPRIIDLDLIFYDGVVMNLPELTLPHPALGERAFVLEPLAEIAPGWVHPVSGKSVEELLGGTPLPPAYRAKSS